MLDIDKKSVGARIQSIRKSKGMTLEEFGKLFGASKSSVLGWEKGDNIPNNERLKQIAKIGDLTVDELQYGNFKAYIARALSQFLTAVFTDYTVNQMDFEKALSNILEEASARGYSYSDIDSLQALIIAKTSFIQQKYIDKDLLYKNVSRNFVIDEYVQRLSDVQLLPDEFEESEVKKHADIFSKGYLIIGKAIDELEKQKKKIVQISDKQIEYDARKRVVAIVDFSASAGTGVWQDENLGMEVSFYEDDMAEDYDSIGIVMGSSMEPVLKNGDYLFVKVTTDIPNGSLSIWQVNGENFVKKFRSNGIPYLESLNTDYDDITLDENDDIRPLGVVVDVYREN